MAKKGIFMVGDTGKRCLLTGTAVFFLFLSALAGCKNFMNDTQPNPFMDSIEATVWDATAPQLSVMVQANDPREGITSPNGRITVKQKIAFSVQFAVDSAYGFIRWAAYDSVSGLPAAPGVVQFTDTSALETQVVIHASLGNYLIRPLCDVRPSVERSTPAPYSTDVLKNVPASIFFYTPVDPSSFVFEDGQKIHGSGVTTAFKNITVTGRGNNGYSPEENCAGYFQAPELSADGTILVLRPSGMLPDKTLIKITLNREVRSRNGVTMAQDYSLTYTTGMAADTNPPYLNFVGFMGTDGHPLAMPVNPTGPGFEESLAIPAIVQRRYTTHIPMAIQGEDLVDGKYLLAVQIGARLTYTAGGAAAAGPSYEPGRSIFINNLTHPFVIETLTAYTATGDTMFIDFPISSLPDGVIELSITLYDQNDTPSPAYKFYAVKDTLAPDIETPANLGTIAMSSLQPTYLDSAGKNWFPGAGAVTLTPAGNPSLADINGYSSGGGSPRTHSEDVYWNFSLDQNNFDDATWKRYGTTSPDNIFSLTTISVGSFTLYARFRDDLGNVSAAKEVGSINIDGTPPVLDPWTITREGTRFRVNLKASDTGSGLKEFEFSITGIAGGTNPTSGNTFAAVSGGGAVKTGIGGSVGSPGVYSKLVLGKSGTDISAAGETCFEFDLNDHLVAGEISPAAGPISGNYNIEVKVLDNVENVRTESASAVSGRDLLDARRPVPLSYTVINGPALTSPEAYYRDDGLTRKFFISNPVMGNNFRIKVKATDKDPDTGGSGLQMAGYLLDTVTGGASHNRQAVFRPVGSGEENTDMLLDWPAGTLGYASTTRNYMDFDLFFRDGKGNLAFYPSDNIPVPGTAPIPSSLLATTGSVYISAADDSYTPFYAGNKRFRVYYDGASPMLSAGSPNSNVDLGSGRPSWHPVLSGVTKRVDRSGGRVFASNAPSSISFKVEDRKSGDVSEASGAAQYLIHFGDNDSYVPAADDTRWTAVPAGGVVTVSSFTGFPDAETGGFGKIYIFLKDNAGNIGPLGAGQGGERPYIHWPVGSGPDFADSFLLDNTAPTFGGVTIANGGAAVPASLNNSVINRDNAADRSWFDITLDNVVEKGAGVRKIRLASSGASLGITGTAEIPGGGYININGQDVRVTYEAAGLELTVTLLDEPLRFTTSGNLVIKHTASGQGISLFADPSNDYDGRTVQIAAILEDDMGLVSGAWSADSNSLMVDSAPPVVTLESAVNSSGAAYTSGTFVLKGTFTEKVAGAGVVAVESNVPLENFNIESIRFGNAATDTWTNAAFTVAGASPSKIATVTGGYPEGTVADIEITVSTSSTTVSQEYRMRMDDRLGRAGGYSDYKTIVYDGTAPQLTGAAFTAPFTRNGDVVLNFTFKETGSGLHRIYLDDDYFNAVTNGTVLNSTGSPLTGVNFDYDPVLKAITFYNNAGVPKSTGDTAAVIGIPLVLKGVDGTYTVSVTKAGDFAGNEQTSGPDFPAAGLVIVKDGVAPVFGTPSIVNDGSIDGTPVLAGYSSGNVTYTIPFTEAVSGLAELGFDSSNCFAGVTEIFDGTATYTPGSGTGAFFSYADSKITFTGTTRPKVGSSANLVISGSLPSGDGSKIIRLSSAKDLADNATNFGGSPPSVSITRDITAPAIGSAGLSAALGGSSIPNAGEFVLTMPDVTETGSGLGVIGLTVPSGVSLSGIPVVTFSGTPYSATLAGSTPNYTVDVSLSSFKPNNAPVTIRGLSASASAPGDTGFTIDVKLADRLLHEMALSVTSTTLTIDKTAPVFSGAVIAGVSGAVIASGDKVELALSGVTETGTGLSSLTLTPPSTVTVTGTTPGYGTVDGTAYPMTGGASPGVPVVIDVSSADPALKPDSISIVITDLAVSTSAASDVSVSFTVKITDRGSLDSLPVPSTGSLTLDRTNPLLSGAALERASGTGVYIVSGEGVKLTLSGVTETGTGLSSLTLTLSAGVTVTGATPGYATVDGTAYPMTGDPSPGDPVVIDVSSADPALKPDSISIVITGIELSAGADVSASIGVKVTDRGGLDSPPVTSGVLYMDQTAPVVVSASLLPATPSFIENGGAVDVSFTVTETGSGLKTITVTSTNSDVSVGTGAVTLTYNSSSVSGTFSLNASGEIDVSSVDPALKSGTLVVSGITVTGEAGAHSAFELKVQLTDRMDNTGTDVSSANSLTVDRLVPSAVSAALARVSGSDTWIGESTPIKVTLNTLTDNGGIGVKTITLAPTAGVSINSDTITAGGQSTSIDSLGVITLTSPVTSAASFDITGLSVMGPADADTPFAIDAVLADVYGNTAAAVTSSTLTLDNKGPEIGTPTGINTAGTEISGISISDAPAGYTHSSGFVSLTGHDTTNDAAVTFSTIQGGSATSATYTMSPSPFDKTPGTSQVIKFELTLKDNAGNETVETFYIRWNGASFDAVSSTALSSMSPGWLGAGISAVSGFFQSLAGGPSPASRTAPASRSPVPASAPAAIPASVSSGALNRTSVSPAGTASAGPVVNRPRADRSRAPARTARLDVAVAERAARPDTGEAAPSVLPDSVRSAPETASLDTGVSRAMTSVTRLPEEPVPSLVSPPPEQESSSPASPEDSPLPFRKIVNEAVMPVMGNLDSKRKKRARRRPVTGGYL
jgi:hypothetical protein